MTVRPTARWAVGVAAAALLLGAAGCTQDPNSVAAQARAGDQKGYVSGDGAVETIPADKRGTPVDLKGELLDGTAWDAASARGKVLVLNVWGSWCAPCVAEAPALQKTWSDLQADQAPVDFMGIDFREDPARGAAFAKKAGVTYPSLSDESGAAIRPSVASRIIQIGAWWLTMTASWPRAAMRASTIAWRIRSTSSTYGSPHDGRNGLSILG